jgi:cell division protein FtsI (penicillin-binding protein 3)
LTGRRLLVVAIVGGCWMLGISARLYQLQVSRYEHYRTKAARQQQRVIKLDPPRGTIYDSQGRELAVSVQVDSAYAVPPEIEDPQRTAEAIARIVHGLDARKLARELSRDREFVWVARKLDSPVADAVRALDLKGIYFVEESKRYYPMRELAAQVLGYVGTDNHGLAGLELLYDEVVAGRPGVRTVLRDAKHGTVVAQGLAFSEAEPGQDLHLTLDAAVQHIAERELEKAVTERHASRGIAIFLDPETGSVLAMASYPGFDPNEFDRFTPASWRNRAIMDVYEPGSTFKIVTAAAALGSGLVHSSDMFDCGMGSIVVFGKRIHDHNPYGLLSFADVIAKSSNVGVIRAALEIGDERLYGAVRGFGFGKPTGIDLPGEGAGIVHPIERWGLRDKCYISFGQGISVTPLQLVNAVGAVANGGRLLRPYVVASVGRNGAFSARHARPTVAGEPISPAVAQELTRLLEGVVTGGTGKTAAIPGYRVAGKTGTAQIPVAGGYRGYLPSFVGFAPAGHPRLVGIVAVAEPQGYEHFGGQVAAPVFAAVSRQVLLYLGVRPEREPLAAWPGQPTVLAKLAAPSTSAAAPAGPELDDLPPEISPEPGGEPAPPVSPVSPASPASPVAGGAGTAPVRPSSPHPASRGGRPHASF